MVPNKIKEKLNLLVIILLVLALASIVISLIKLSVALWFWIILIIWILIFFLYFFTTIFKILLYFWITFTIWIIFSLFVSFGIIFDFASTTSGTKNTSTINGITVTDCTSKLSDTPEPLNDWKVTIYSAPLKSPGALPSEANNVRTFSYAKINDDTSTDSVYAELRKADDSVITGYDTTIEACNQDNKTGYSYSTSSYTSSSVAGENVTARVHYLHGGSYLFGPGTYRIDAYIKDLNGKWHFVDRMSDIQITE